MATSTTLSGALVDLFLATPAIIAVCPLMFTDEIPTVTPAGLPINPPFAELAVTEEVPEWNFEAATPNPTGYYDVDQVTITVYGRSAAERDAMVAAFEAGYDWAMAIPLAPATLMSLMRTRISKPKPSVELVLDQDGNRVFHAYIEYQVMVTR
jgi:hypothetical protein